MVKGQAVIVATDEATAKSRKPHDQRRNHDERDRRDPRPGC